MDEQSQQPVSSANSSDEYMWAMLCHLSGLLGFIFPLGNIAGPAIIWALKKDEYPFVNDQGKEAINFQISMTIYIIASVILVFLAIGIVFLIALALFSLIIIIVAALKANNGEKFRYPFTIRFLM